jgi:phosphoglycolate phosphatase-like HAD superfamily hydrolase
MNPSLLNRLFAEGVLPDLFEAVASVHDIPESHLQKPHPKLLLDLLSSMNVKPERACYVGDSLPDIEMARRAGVVSVAVLTGSMNRTQAEEAKPNYILDSMREIHTIL